MKVEIYIPLRRPFTLEEHALISQKSFFAALATEPDRLPRLAQLRADTFRVDILSAPEFEPALSGRWKSSEFIKYRLLRFSFSEDSQEITHQSLPGLTDEALEVVKREHAVTCAEFEVNVFLMIVNIFWPGAASSPGGFGFVDETYVTDTQAFYADHFERASAVAAQNSWPPLCALRLADIWNWLIRSQALIDGVGVGRLGRALSALSHVSTASLHDQSNVSLVWILMGLESLYSKGNVGLKEQLMGKTEAILGPRQTNKKSFSAMYDYRSRLLHGDVDLPLRFSPFDGVRNYESFRNELYQNEDLALAALIGTIHWMAANDQTELSFSYSYRPPLS